MKSIEMMAGDQKYVETYDEYFCPECGSEVTFMYSPHVQEGSYHAIVVCKRCDKVLKYLEQEE